MKKFLQGHRWVRIVLRILLILLVLLLAAIIAIFAFLRLWPSFGGRPDSEDRAEYERRSDIYENGTFADSDDYVIMSEYTDRYADRTSGKGSVPAHDLPTLAPSFLSDPKANELSVTWLGHSSTLVQMHGLNIIFDPVLSDIVSPVSFIGSERYSDVPLEADELPDIDICIITHDHYDHLDMPTIEKIDDRVALYVVPLGVGNHLERWGADPERITELAWWEETEFKGLTIGCVPAQHYSGRSIDDRYFTLWTSWVLEDEYYRIYESGDTGYGAHFEQIAERYGSFDLALMDCAQYNGAWHNVHMFPEEAVDAARTLGAGAVMPIHWGAFRLSDHAWDDPAERMVQYGEEQKVEIITPRLGETVDYDDLLDFRTRWWRDLK